MLQVILDLYGLSLVAFSCQSATWMKENNFVNSRQWNRKRSWGKKQESRKKSSFWKHSPFYNVSSGHVKPQNNSWGRSFPTSWPIKNSGFTPRQARNIISRYNHIHTFLYACALWIFDIILMYKINSTTYICLIHLTCQAVTRQIISFLLWRFFSTGEENTSNPRSIYTKHWHMDLVNTTAQTS